MPAMHKSHALRVALVVCLLPLISRAAVTLPPIFGDHMVLQREMKTPIWGKASPGEKVTIEFAGKKNSTKADQDGMWQAKFPSMRAGTKGDMTISSSEGGTIVIKDVLVGDVWIASGQSNMQ